MPVPPRGLRLAGARWPPAGGAVGGLGPPAAGASRCAVRCSSPCGPGAACSAPRRPSVAGPAAAVRGGWGRGTVARRRRRPARCTARGFHGDTQPPAVTRRLASGCSRGRFASRTWRPKRALRQLGHRSALTLGPPYASCAAIAARASRRRRWARTSARAPDARAPHPDRPPPSQPRQLAPPAAMPADAAGRGGRRRTPGQRRAAPAKPLAPRRAARPPGRRVAPAARPALRPSEGTPSKATLRSRACAARTRSAPGIVLCPCAPLACRHRAERGRGCAAAPRAASAAASPRART